MRLLDEGEPSDKICKCALLHKSKRDFVGPNGDPDSFIKLGERVPLDIASQSEMLV